MLQHLIREAEAKSRIRDRHVTIAFSESDSTHVKLNGKEKYRSKQEPHLYVARHGQREPQLVKRTNIPGMLGGVCLGVECIEFPQLRRKPLRKDQDLVDKKAGLSLVIDPDYETTVAIDVNASDLIYVPVSAQDFDATFA